MKQIILGLTISLVSSCPALAGGPLIGGGGGGGLNSNLATTNEFHQDGTVILSTENISDIRLKDENIVRLQDLLNDHTRFEVEQISKGFIKVDLSQKSGIADIQLIDGSIIGGDMGGGSSLN